MPWPVIRTGPKSATFAPIRAKPALGYMPAPETEKPITAFPLRSPAMAG